MRLAVCLVLVLWLAQPAEAACTGTSPNLTVSDLTQAEFNNCLTAAVDGDTITVPGGLYTFSALSSVSGKSISIIGTYPTLSISSISAANPPVVTTTGSHGFEDNQGVTITGTSGTGSLTINGHQFRINVTAATTFELLDVDLTGGAPTGGSAVANATRTLCEVGAQTTYTCFTRAGVILSITTAADAGVSPVGFTRVSGIGFIVTGGTGCSTYDAGGLTISGVSANVRLDHLHVDNTSCTGIVVQDYVRGVIDHSSCMLRTQDGHCRTLTHESWISGSYGDRSWSEASTKGTANVWVSEDNLYQHTLSALNFFVDEDSGSRSVYRYDRWYGGSYANHGVETGGRKRSAFTYEIYRNYFNYQHASAPSLIGTRGGHGPIFQNTAVGAMTRVSDMVNYRSNGDTRQWYPWGQCGQSSATIDHVGTTAIVTDTGHNMHTGGSGPRMWVTVSGATGTGASEYNIGPVKASTRILTMTSASAANPTVITTSADHMLGSGQQVTLSGSSGAGSGTINGNTYTITVTGATTFTVPVNLSGGGATGGSATSLDTFSYPMSGDPGAAASGSPVYVSPYDENSQADGENCLDQPGMGTGGLISGDIESGTNPSVGGVVTWPTQALVPIVVFRNTDDGTLSAIAANAGNSGNIIANKHYYNEHTTFNCTSNLGVGVNTAATMNALSGCTGTPYFWVTDETDWDASVSGNDGRLYKWDGDSWEVNYTPYAYPHELTEGAQADVTPPVVTITNPTSAATFGTGVSPLTTLAGTCTDDIAVSSVTWSSSRGGSGSATGTTSWSVASITLQAGDNVITVTCTDSSSNTHQDALTVSFGAAPYSIRLRRIRRP
jgi:hypothetical protein